MARIRSTARRSVKFLTEFEEQSSDTLEIPEDLTGLSDEELASLSTQATEAFNALYDGGNADLSEADLEALSAIAEGLQALQAESATRGEAAAERAQRAAELAATIAPEAEADEDEADEADEDEADEDEASAEADEADEAAAEDEQESVTASGRRQTRINLGALRGRTRSTRSSSDQPADRTMRDIVLAAPDLPQFSTGQGMDWNDLGRGVDSRLRSFNDKAYKAAAKSGRRMREQLGIATIQKPFEDDLIVRSSDPSHIEAVFDRAVDETRLPGGSLVASGGWCAPSEIIYDLCEMETREGLLSVPEIQISRGGIRFAQGPDFSSLFADTGFCYTEAEDIAGDYDGEGGGSKPCFHVECPEFEEERLQLCGVCITAGLLQRRGYPEAIARTIRGALVAHDHRVSSAKIAEMVAGSTAVQMTAGQVGTTAPILTAVELHVQHYRALHRLGLRATLEAIFPHWVHGAIRADLSRRLGVDLLDVSDQRINGWFAQRGINPQFVYNWQGMESTAASALVAYPTEVDFLLYRAGTWVAGGADIITLDTVYDSTLLGTNDYTALFTEEGWLMAKRCPESRVITVPICPDGATAAGVDIACTGAAA